MIKMVCDAEAGGQVPAIVAPEIISDIEDVRKLRDSLSEILETVLYDEDLTYCTPNSHLYVVAHLVNTLTRDIEKAAQKGGDQ